MALPSDYQMLGRALELARHSLSYDELPVGAVLGNAHGRVLGMGWKKPDLHWRLDHAEIVALRDALPARPPKERGASDDMLKGLTLYTTLEPCVMCIGAIMNCRIRRVVYALEDSYGGGFGLLSGNRPPRHEQEYPDMIGGVMRDESMALFREYFKTTQNKFWKNPDNPLVRLCTGPS